MGWGGGHEGANKILAAWPSRSPGACLCSVESFSLSFGPADTSWLVTGWGRGGGGGELGEALRKEKKEVKNGFCGAAVEERACMPHLGGRQPSQVPGHAGTCWKPEPWLADRGWTVEPEFKGAAGGGGASWGKRGRLQ